MKMSILLGALLVVLVVFARRGGILCLDARKLHDPVSVSNVEADVPAWEEARIAPGRGPTLRKECKLGWGSQATGTCARVAGGAAGQLAVAGALTSVLCEVTGEPIKRLA